MVASVSGLSTRPCSPEPPHLLLAGAGPAAGQRPRTRRGVDARGQVSEEDAIGYLRHRGITLTHDPVAGTLQAGTAEAAKA